MIDTPTAHYKIAKTEAHFAIWGNLALFIFKFWVGLSINSIAVIADAWHTLSDSLSSIILLIGVHVAEKPADEKHPYGHGRAELIASFSIGIMLVLVGFQFGYKSIEDFIAGEKANYNWLALIAMLVTVLIKEAMAQYALWGAKKTGFSSLKADAWHHRSDAISSIIIIIGIGVSWIFGTSVWWIDSVMGFTVAIIILYAAWTILCEVIEKLMGNSPDAAFITKIKQLCDGFCYYDTEVHHVHLHEYGGHKELIFHIRCDGNEKIEDVHALVMQLETHLQKELNMEVTIHYEPKKKTNLTS